MTVRETVETVRNGRIDFVQIISKDYRGCSAITKEQFIRKYKGTDTWHETIKDFCIENHNGSSFTLLVIAL